MDEPIPDEAKGPLEDFNQALAELEHAINDFVSVPVGEKTEVSSTNSDVCLQC